MFKKNNAVRNLPKKPNNGGIPAKDKKTNTVQTKTYWLEFKFFNSFKVLKYLISCKKKTKKIFIISII